MVVFEPVKPKPSPIDDDNTEIITPPVNPDPEPQQKKECKMGQIQIDKYNSMNEDLLIHLELATN